MWSWWDCMRWWDSAAWDGTTPWFMFLPMLWPIVMIGGIIVLVVLLMRRGRTETPPTWRRNVSRQTPFEILSERFARGEIDRHEYEERKGLLSQP
jgi:putative membrane protein